MRSLLLACAVLAVAGCGAQVESTFVVVADTPDATATGEASTPSSASPSFDVALVKSNFTFECHDPLLVDALFFDALFCEQVKIDDMTASGRLLTVRTTLHAGAFDRAAAICHQVAVAHLDHDTGADLGYRDIEVLDQSDDYLADCRFIPS
jgi:hypothetical protein